MATNCLAWLWRLKHHLLVVACAVFLTGCYPEYNWRELPVGDGLATLAFPAKVDKAARPVELGGLKVTFDLTSAEANDTLFSFGYAQLPQGHTPAQAKAVQRALIDSLAASMGKPAPPQAYAGEVFRLASEVRGQSLVMVARVLVHHDIAMRVVASGPPDRLTDDVAQEFMRSLVLR